MNFWQLRNQFYDLVCFNINQVYTWQPDFEKNNFTRWTKENFLVKLRDSWYSFPDCLKTPNIQKQNNNMSQNPKDSNVYRKYNVERIFDPHGVAPFIIWPYYNHVTPLGLVN